MSVTIDGFDLAGLGFTLADAPQWRDASRRTRAQVPRAGRWGVLDLGVSTSVEIRTLELVGIQKAADADALVAALDALKRRLGRGEMEVTLPDTPARFYRATLEAVRVEPIRPAFTQRAHGLRIVLLCADPRAYDTADSAIAFTTATEMPLGSAPVAPVIRITTPDEPVIIYRDSSGTEVGRLELSTTGVTWVEIDNALGTITDHTGSDRSADLAGGDFLTLDPADGSADGADHPTLEVSGGTGTATFRRAWV